MLVTKGRCEKHRKGKGVAQGEAERRARGTSHQRGYDKQWSKVRKQKLSIDPLCEHCFERGRTTAAQMVHHKVPVDVNRALRLVLENLESLCWSCHSLEHARMQRDDPDGP